MQAGVSVTDNLGFTFGLSGTEHATEVKGIITEGGLCYYFNDEKIGKVEFLAGAGVGKSEALEGYYFRFNNQIPSSPYNYGNFTRLYLQPGIGHSFDNFELAISSRFSWVNVTQIKSTSYSQNAMNGKIRGFFIEPAFTAGVGSETVKFFFQGGFSFPPYYPRFDFNLLLLEIGLKLILNISGKEKNGQINNGQL